MTRRGTPLLLLAVLALLPFGRASELPLLVAAVLGIADALRGRIDWSSPTARLAVVLWLGYWLPEVVSAFDAIDPDKAWREVALDLRYLPILLFGLRLQHDHGGQRWLLHGAALLLALWVLDALLQALTGWSLGGPIEADRLSGIFGADDLKLGGALATLSPLLLWPAWQYRRALGIAAFAAVLVVVLLAGARAAWLTLGLVVLLLAWQALPRRQALLAISAAALLALLGIAAGYHGSERFAARIDRSAAALSGDAEALDHALSFRLPIWNAALSMVEAHPVNGVGARSFRHAYPQHAPADDRWQNFDGEAGAFHAHQWVLEVLSETGVIGLLCWLAAIAAAVRVWWRAAPAARQLAFPAGVALVAMVFPLNTHYAFYSSVWGGLLFWLLAVWLPAIGVVDASRAGGKDRG